MRRLAAVGTIVAALALPAMGQHQVSHGGGLPGHAVSAPHFGGFASRAPVGRSGPVGIRPTSPMRGFSSQRPIGIHPGPGPRAFNPRVFNRGSAPVRFGSANHPGMTRMPYRGRGFGPDRSRSPHDGGDHHHHHRMIYWNGGVYPYSYFYPGPIFTGYVDPWLFGPEMYGYGDSSDYGGYDGSGYAGDMPAPYRDYGTQPSATEDYTDQSAMSQGLRRQSYAPQNELSGGSGSLTRQDAVTVIFKDGRPPEKIQNYLLTSTTLTVLDPTYRQIPLDQINVAATEQANRTAGIDFRVPDPRHD